MSKNNQDIKNENNLNENNSKQNEKNNNIDTIINLKEDEKEENPSNINKDIESNQQLYLDHSLNQLKNDGFQNDTINRLNVKNPQNDKITEKKPSMMQNTKSWISKTWNNIKNYDYSKWNIFKGEEMEECLDAHGFPMKIPKRKHNQQPEKKEENKNETKTKNVNNKK